MKTKNLLIFTLIFAILVSLTYPAYSKKNKYGTLKIYSKIGFVTIYIDNEFAGETPFESDEIEAGKHLVTGVIGGETVYEEEVKIKKEETTTIYIERKPERTLPWIEKEKEVKKEVDFKQKTISGPFFRVGYASMYYSSLYVYGPEYSASSFTYGIGYKLGLTPFIDIMLTVDRADYGSPDGHWYLMPVSILFAMSYYQSPYLVGKQYYGIGLTQYLTDLETDTGDNLSIFGYTIVYGLEMPISEKNTMFFDIIYSLADNSQYEYSLYGTSIVGGMRMGL